MARKPKFELEPILVNDELIGERLASLRKVRNITQGELATLIGITQVMVSRIERGSIQLSVDMLIRFSQALGTTADEVLRSDPPNATRTPLRLARRFKKIEALSPEQQNNIIQSIDGALKMAGVPPEEDEKK